MKTTLAKSARSFGCLAAAAAACLALGCDNKETMLDIDTPDGGVEVQRDRDTGEVDVEVDEEG
ncbi:hypothetical protein [Botrimarina sp.]|uniref:hypothetical protein n=1 Tax=Botrimarina sp. TaxID=2795802 RepID=UPI0032EACE3C